MIYLSSDAFYDDANLPKKFTCEGKKINPPLTISGVPLHAASLVLFLENSDTGEICWLLADIPPKTTQVFENSAPYGSKTLVEYNAPCPEEGLVKYDFKVVALRYPLAIKKAKSAEELDKQLFGNIISFGELNVVYKGARRKNKETQVYPPF